ncbi:MAG: dehydrogenase [Leptospiraceae bacterium]|nr:MAG: dehydrogenase [Leptospiraceae bacterium]
MNINKTIFITGSTDGIGKALALQLLQENHQVIFHGRNKERLNSVLKEIKEKTGKICLGYLADLSNFEDISLMCEKIQKEVNSIDVLIHNAGTYEKSLQFNKDGIEKTFAVNYISNVLINEKLFHYFNQNLEERKKNQKNLRIILVSSIAHQSGQFSLEYWFKPDTYNPYLAYANSKMAQIMYCYYISEYFKEFYITINTLHPGVIDTKILRDNFGMKGAPISEGTKTIYYLALSKEVENITGKYFINQKIEQSSPDTYNKEYQEKLYLKTKEVIQSYL